MAFYLVVDGQNWKLDRTTDPHKLRDDIEAAMQAESPTVLRIDVAVPTRTVLLLNPRAVGQAAVVSQEEAPGS